MRKFTEQETVRRDKVKEIAKFTNPYPERFEINYELKDAALLADETKDVKIAGRIVLMRKMGKLSFLTIGDIQGKIQVSIKMDVVGEENYTKFKEIFDLGDFIGVEGETFTTHTGEKTVRANSYVFLGKALKPLPEKYHGLNDQEIIYRNRYVDLITNEESKKKFLLRSNIIKEIRNYLNNIGYIEIETPVLCNKASGAIAKPFTSHHNALDMGVFLRIAPETYLKRAVVGGFTKVFEIARCFRNEGMDHSHLQDFTMIEGYGAYLNYEDNMVLLRNMLQTVIEKLYGTLTINFAGKDIDLSGNWDVVTYRDLLIKHANIDINVYNDKEKLLKKIKEDNIEIESETDLDDLGYGNLVDQLYKKVARPFITGPIYLIKHPIALSPLSRANDDNKDESDRFHLIINGAEIINGYSELVDPIEQENRLIEQARLKAEGDDESMPMDYDYISAMEYGMPPISGWGMGIDRLVQLLTNSDNIKDIVMFPLMRPFEKQEKDEDEE